VCEFVALLPFLHAAALGAQVVSCARLHGAGKITIRGVEGLPFDTTVDALRHLCPSARDTSIGLDAGRSYPALVFPLRIVAIATQQSAVGAKLIGNRPPDGWLLQGHGDLPGGLSLDSPWSAFVKTLGAHQLSAGSAPDPHQVSAEGWLLARFCSLPRFLFTFEVPAEALSIDENGVVDEGSIPATARVHHITVLAGTLTDALTPCGP